LCEVEADAGRTGAFHDPAKSETWVKFTLYMVQNELAKRGKSRNVSEITHGIQIMTRCVLTLSNAKPELWDGAILQALVTADREEYSPIRPRHLR
jgi:hypothetical protein